MGKKFKERLERGKCIEGEGVKGNEDKGKRREGKKEIGGSREGGLGKVRRKDGKGNGKMIMKVEKGKREEEEEKGG